MKKGITPVISIIVLLLIAIAMAGAAWTYISGTMFGMISKSFDIPIGGAYCQDGMIKLYVRNTGQANLTAGDFIMADVDGYDLGTEIKNRFSGIDTTGMVLYFNFDDGTATDLSGSGNNGTLHDTSLVSGKAGNALEFDGEKSFICLDNKTGLCDGTDSNPTFDDAFTERTVELWFKANDVISTQVLYEEGGGNNGLNIYISDGFVYAGAWALSENPPWDAYLQSVPVNSGQWYHVATVFNGSENFEIYLNGSLINSVASGAAMHSHSGDDAMGCVKQGTKLDTGSVVSGYCFNGIIDEVRIYNRALSPEEIQQHYTGGKLAPGDSMLLINTDCGGVCTSGIHTLNLGTSSTVLHKEVYCQ